MPGQQHSRVSSNEARAAVEAVWRSESARIVGALARYTGDFALAEDLAQEALAEALVSWSVNGIPAEPAGWLLTAGRRRAIDTFRRRAARDEKYALLARDLSEEEPGADALFDPDAIDDDVLALMFISCHPVLSKEARIALTLRVVGGMGHRRDRQGVPGLRCPPSRPASPAPRRPWRPPTYRLPCRSARDTGTAGIRAAGAST